MGYRFQYTREYYTNPISILNLYRYYRIKYYILKTRGEKHELFPEKQQITKNY